MKKLVKIAEIWAESTKSRDTIAETLENAGFTTSYVENFDTQLVIMKAVEDDEIKFLLEGADA